MESQREESIWGTSLKRDPEQRTESLGREEKQGLLLGEVRFLECQGGTLE